MVQRVLTLEPCDPSAFGDPFDPWPIDPLSTLMSMHTCMRLCIDYSSSSLSIVHKIWKWWNFKNYNDHKDIRNFIVGDVFSWSRSSFCQTVAWFNWSFTSGGCSSNKRFRRHWLSGIHRLFTNKIHSVLIFIYCKNTQFYEEFKWLNRHCKILQSRQR
jgi:magnesium-transporting ATPase (P-type)